MEKKELKINKTKFKTLDAQDFLDWKTSYEFPLAS